MPVFLVLATWLLIAPRAPAHFDVSLQASLVVCHVDHREDGIHVMIRLPMPYLIEDKLGAIQDDGLPIAAPFTSNALEGDRIVHFVDRDAFTENPLGLGKILENAIGLKLNQRSTRGVIEGVRIHRADAAPPFDSLDDAVAVFKPGTVPQLDEPAIQQTSLYVGDALVFARLSFAHDGNLQMYSLQSNLTTASNTQETAVTLVLDHGISGTRIFRSAGLLAEPLSISHSSYRDYQYLVVQGIEHVLEGLDHVLFVVCLSLGSLSFGALLWRVTGFTVGHSLT
ncbi:MAG: HupE/UreJ family protein, partial [Pseudomonadota bacterium]